MSALCLMHDPERVKPACRQAGINNPGLLSLSKHTRGNLQHTKHRPRQPIEKSTTAPWPESRKHNHNHLPKPPPTCLQQQTRLRQLTNHQPATND
ncbi:MAG TPA: hypothetical protein VJ909_07540 [Prolixibacteraceae bacterium]|nr:hypothetical protein [Prolixibacteraceae bacterium]